MMMTLEPMTVGNRGVTVDREAARKHYNVTFAGDLVTENGQHYGRCTYCRDGVHSNGKCSNCARDWVMQNSFQTVGSDGRPKSTGRRLIERLQREEQRFA